MLSNRHQPFLAGSARGSGFARLIAALMSALTLIVAAVLGAFALLAALGVLIVTAVVVTARIAWLRRRMRKGRPMTNNGGPADRRSNSIDGEYRVIHTPDAVRQRSGD